MKEQYISIIKALLKECGDLELLDLIYRILEKSQVS